MSMALSKMNGSRAQQVNRALLLNTLRYETGHSRASLARYTGLSTTAAASIVNELMDLGMVVETEEWQETARGRKGKIVRLNPAYAVAIGLELTDRDLHGILVGFNERPLQSVHRDVSGLEREAILDLLAGVILQLKRAAPPEAMQKRASVAIHGLVDVERGVSLSFPGGRGWEPTPVAEILAPRVGLPVRLDVRMLAATTAELRFGAGRMLTDFVYFNSAPGSGFGIGIVVDGRILAGQQGFSGQFGHLCVDQSGRQCFCGSRGCLVTVASPDAAVEQANRAIQSGVQTVLAHDPGRELRFADIVDAAERGDKFSTNLLETVGESLGLGFSYVINLLNPGTIVLAGSLAQAGDLVLDGIKRAARLHSVAALYERVRFVRSDLDEKAGALGAATRVLDETFAVLAG